MAAVAIIRTIVGLLAVAIAASATNLSLKSKAPQNAAAASIRARASDGLLATIPVPPNIHGFDRLRGSSERGKQLWSSDRLQCSACHEVTPQADGSYPSLHGVSGRLSHEQMVLAVLNPSAEFTPGFKMVTIALRDGRLLTGVEQTAVSTDTELVLLDELDQVIRIARSEIEELEVTVSAMPEGQIEAAELTAQEFADLLVYLETL